MSTRGRLAAVALALLAPSAALAHWVSTVGRHGSAVVLPAIADRIGAWRLEAERRMEDAILDVLQPDAYLWRVYGAEDREPIQIYVAMYGGRAAYGRGAHDPNVCFPSQGWEVVESRPVEVALDAGDLLSARLLRAHQGEHHETVLYWFQPAERWPRSEAREQLTRIFDAVRGRPQYAFVRLSSASLDSLEAERDLVEVAREIARPIRSALGPAESNAPTLAALEDSTGPGECGGRAAVAAESGRCGSRSR